VECATAEVPKDWRNTRSAANRIGSLFLNFGGPGGAAAEYLEAYGSRLFPERNKRFDLIGMDPRGVGQSRPSITCPVDQEQQGIYSQPFATPFNTEIGDLIAKVRSYIDACLQRTAGTCSSGSPPLTSRATWTRSARAWASRS
jgi:pimeloyl-ACP methyl ester carboxylesterase